MSGSLKIRSRVHDYEVFFDGDFSFLEKLAALPNAVCVADRKVFSLYRAQLEPRFSPEKLFLAEASEDKKTLAGAMEIYAFLTKQAAKKNLKIIAIGGGIIQDLAGFAASTLFRGVEWHYVPTTLLAQADSCIGGKTSINFESFKNLLGTFYPPAQVHICSAFLASLDPLDFASGLGEIIKLLLMAPGPKDLAALQARLEKAASDPAVVESLVRDSLEAKISYMQDDEFDQGKRNLLNFGHCYGHALESSSHYYVPHGIAVNVGMIFANLLAVKRSLMPDALAQELNSRLHLPHMALKMRREDFEAAVLFKAMQNDKKRTGAHLSVVVPDAKLEFLKLDDVTEDEFNAVHRALLAQIF